MQTLYRLIASGFGSGYSSVAPGTVGSITCFLGWMLVHIFLPLTWGITLVLALFVSVLGMICTQECLKEELKHQDTSLQTHLDPSWIVIDEWAGLLFALVLSTPQSLPNAIGALLLFRFFDIKKPGVIGKMEALGGATGIMADDILAGIFALLSLEGILWLWSTLIAGAL